jgi:Transposase
MRLSDIRAKVVGATAFIAQVCRDLGIADKVNRMVEWDQKQWKLSPGTRVVALIINIICHRQPLYRVWEFYEHLDLGLLFDQPVTLEDLNDDGFARTLDRLHASGELRRLVHTVALAAVRRLPLGIRSVHADTTSISLQGEFEGTESDRDFQRENPDRPLLNITHGYSKDHRPDLKQFIYGLVVSKEGLPLLATVNDGNTSDKKWNLEVIREIQQSFLDPVELLYVADSALITRENLEEMARAGLRFVSRLPETYKVAGEFKERAFEENRWELIGRLAESPHGAVYRSCSYTGELYGRTYRFIVVHSSSKDKRSLKALEKRIDEERTALEAAVAQLGKERFACREDAQKAWDQFADERRPRYHRLEGEVVAEEVVKRPPGRPRRDAPVPTITRYAIRARVLPPTEEQRQMEEAKASTFVLITTEPEDVYSDAAILEEYKLQTAVETRFRNLKSRPNIVDNIYVKSLRRAEALAYVFLLALIVASYIEIKIRQELAVRQRPFLVPGNRWTQRPTMTMIFDVLSSVCILQIPSERGLRRFLPDDTDPRVYELLDLMGFDHRVYTRPPGAGLK